VPADRKWFARICVSAIMAHTLMGIDPKFPELPQADRDQLAGIRAQLVAEDS
jgi:hypothetical protein